MIAIPDHKLIETIVGLIIPHEEQRYPSLGDYFCDDKYPNIDQYRMSDFSKVESDCTKARMYAIAVMIHEIVEFELCKRAGIAEQLITDFDMAFEALGKPGEPGDDIEAPYHDQHVKATQVEKAVIDAFGLSWMTYEAMCEEMFHGKE